MGVMIFASSCAGCRRPGPVLCRTCRLVLAAPPAMPTSGDVIAAVPFVGRPREVILSLKYGNRRQLGHHLAGLVVNRILASGLRPDDIDVVTWAPTSSSRRHRRGFDQAELVARRVALQLGVPCRRLLRRDGAAPPQTGLDRAMRLHGPVFTAAPNVAGQRVLVVDDVVTTGSTLRSAARALEQAGAVDVRKAAVATTPAIVARQQTAASGSRRRSTASRTVVHGPWAA
jgi:predicted amidophosphoribosyltransferase